MPVSIRYLLLKEKSHSEEWKKTSCWNQVDKKEDCVIATGGGMVLIDGALDVMKSSGKVFFLKRSLKQILPILRKDNDRPLAINKEKKELYFKYKARLKTYRKANFRIYNRNEQTALNKILNMIK